MEKTISWKNFRDQDKTFELFFDFVLSNMQLFSVTYDNWFIKFIYASNLKYVLPENFERNDQKNMKPKKKWIKKRWLKMIQILILLVMFGNQ